jgi:chemotaxis protein methyltransferase CheR
MAHANLGRHAAALECCRQAIAADGFDPRAYLLIAHVLEEQGDLEAAKELFKKVIYLAPTSIAAYLELAAIYQRENDIIRARQMRATVLDLLREMPPETVPEACGGATAHDIITMLAADAA